MYKLNKYLRLMHFWNLRKKSRFYPLKRAVAILDFQLLTTGTLNRGAAGPTLIDLLCDGTNPLPLAATTFACVLAIINKRSELAPGLSPAQLKDLARDMGDTP